MANAWTQCRYSHMDHYNREDGCKTTFYCTHNGVKEILRDHIIGEPVIHGKKTPAVRLSGEETSFQMDRECIDMLFESADSILGFCHTCPFFSRRE